MPPLHSVKSQPKRLNVLFSWPAALVLFCIAMIVVVVLKMPHDPDFWWHLKIGEQIAHGEFSYSNSLPTILPDYPWVNHSWLTDLIIYEIYRVSGLAGVVTVFTMLIMVIAWLTYRIGLRHLAPSYSSATRWLASPPGALAIILLTLVPMRQILGTRPQMVSLLGFVIIYHLLLKADQGNSTKPLWWAPVVFMLWANLHGGYAIGLGLWGLFLLAKLIQKGIRPFLADKVVWQSAGFLLASTLACLINPYGYRIFEETIRTSTDSFASRYIQEWLPLNPSSIGSWITLTYYGAILFLALIHRKSLSWVYRLGLPVFVVLGVSTSRHLPFAILFSIPLVMGYLSQIPDSLWRSLQAVLRKPPPNVFAKSIVALTLTLSIVVIVQHTTDTYHVTTDQIALAERLEYPLEELTRIDPSEGRVFNHYAWGGYIAWHFPEIEYFIDGRMASWKTEDAHPLSIYAAFFESESDAKQLLKRHSSQYILLPKNEKLLDTLNLGHDWIENNSAQSSVFFYESNALESF